jgi:hypothetical protein
LCDRVVERHDAGPVSLLRGRRSSVASVFGKSSEGLPCFHVPPHP